MHVPRRLNQPCRKPDWLLTRSVFRILVLNAGRAAAQPRLAVLSVTEFAAAASSAKAQFAQLVPPYLDVSVGAWAIAD